MQDKSSATAYASDIEDNQTMPGVGIEQVLNDCYSSQKEIQVEDYLAPEDKGEYLDMAFANVTSFLYVRSEPTKESEFDKMLCGWLLLTNCHNQRIID